MQISQVLVTQEKFGRTASICTKTQFHQKSLDKFMNNGCQEKSTNPINDSFGIRLIEVLTTIFAALAAAASAWAAWSLNEIEQRKRDTEERMTAIRALAEWSKGQTVAGVNCIAFLSTYGRQEFVISAEIRRFALRPEQAEAASRCFSPYGKKVDPDGNRRIDDAERAHLAGEVTTELNNYEALALYWSELGPKGSQIICEQAKIAQTDPVRTFNDIAKGTAWWRYPRLERFLTGCI